MGGEQLWSLKLKTNIPLKKNIQRNTIIGSDLANVLHGSSGNDRIKGEDGDDIINAGDGDDEIEGGKGQDRFTLSRGHDQILDYQIGESIVIDTETYGRDLKIKQQGSSLMISSTQGLHTELLNTDLTTFQSTNALTFTNEA